MTFLIRSNCTWLHFFFYFFLFLCNGFMSINRLQMKVCIFSVKLTRLFCMVFSTSKMPCYIRVFKPIPILHFHFLLISVMKKHLSVEEALTLLLETSDTDSDTESDVDVLSIDAPEIVGPQAVEISGPFEIDNRNAVYQNLEPMQVDPSSDASDPEPMQVDPHPPALSSSLPPSPHPVSCLHLLLLPQRRKSNACRGIVEMQEVPENYPSPPNLPAFVCLIHLVHCSNCHLPKILAVTNHLTSFPATMNLSPPVPVMTMGQDSCLLNNFLVPLK